MSEQKARSGLLLPLFCLLVSGWTTPPLSAQRPDMSPEKGSVVFVHPDGTGLSGWGAARLMKVGPDGTLNWDCLEKVGVYRGHMKPPWEPRPRVGLPPTPMGSKCIGIPTERMAAGPSPPYRANPTAFSPKLMPQDPPPRS
jgi:hypothetical protein